MAIDWYVEQTHSSARLKAGFTSRHGGVSISPYDSFNCAFHVNDTETNVEANRRLLASELGTEPAWMNQVHGAHIELARRGETFDDTDALIIDLEHMRVDKAAACVMVADCTPLVLLSRDKPRAAVVHVGRAGFMHNIAAKAVEMLDGDLIAVLGPSICGSCYEVGEEMRAQAGEIASDAVCETSWGTPSIDIRAGLRQQLREAGVSEIESVDICTFENRDYYSYRREGATGRFLGIAYVERL